MAIEITVRIDDVENEKSKEIRSADDHINVSPYAAFFNETCLAWSKDSEMNKMFLLQQQTYATEKLRAQGYLFLNDVYDMLGMPRTKAGQIVGWIYEENNPTGDNCVDFDLYAQHNQDFINGYERVALLDFNVDGIILDRVP